MDWIYSKTINELGAVLVEICQTSVKIKEKWLKNRATAEYPRTVGKKQKMLYICNWDARKRRDKGDIF